VIALFVDPGGDRHAHRGPFPDRTRGPILLGKLGRGHGAPGGLAAAPGQPGDLLAGCRVDCRHEVRLGFPGTVDEIAEDLELGLFHKIFP
jgi:hypothetical protein